MITIGELIFWVVLGIIGLVTVVILNSGRACVSEYTRDRINGLKY
jgi:hypothetical protein